MEPTRTPEGIRIGADARQRLHQARGYGEPVGEHEVLLRPLEAAYLLYRGDIPPVDGAEFRQFVQAEATPGFLTRLIVYKDLRERGYYLVVTPEESFDLAVLERGADPPDGTIGFHVRVVAERDPVDFATLEPGVIALVDGEGEVGYIDVDRYTPSGRTSLSDIAPAEAGVIGNRVLVWDPPAALYREGFYGQPLAGRETTEGILQLSLVEALYLAEEGLLSIEPAAIRSVGHRNEPPPRFDARAAVLRELREAGAVAKTGLKFGADFRVYHDFESIEEMGHSDVLVRVRDAEGSIDPDALALDVRLAHGVGKRMVFALTTGSDARITSWLSVTRKTP